MLYHYLDHKRKESSAQVHATYLVSGKFEDNGQTVRTVLDNNLNATPCLCWWCCSSGSPGVCCQRRPVGRCVVMYLLYKSSAHLFPWRRDWRNVWLLVCFADVKSRMSPIVSVHIYSVQKALLKDSGPLYSVDYDAVKDNLENCSRLRFHSATSALH